MALPLQVRDRSASSRKITALCGKRAQQGGASAVKQASSNIEKQPPDKSVRRKPSGSGGSSAPSAAGKGVRNLVLVFGDQLDHDSSAFDDFDPAQDAIWMAEASEEASYVKSHKLRLAFFFSGMRHFREHLQSRGWRVDYHELSEDKKRDVGKNLAQLLADAIKRLQPSGLIAVLPGDKRVEEAVQKAAHKGGLDLEIRDDRHFLITPREFDEFMEGKRSYLLEIFYRWMRRRQKILLDADGNPEGGLWNYDMENREAFPKSGPASLKGRTSFEPDKITQAVMSMVETRFADHPGTLEHWDLPVDREGALIWLNEFVQDHLPNFGRWQDAMWSGQPFLHHARLSAVLNVKLLNPREVLDAALKAYKKRKAPLNAVEGFVRQIIGWREYIRGIYYREMPEYQDLNYFEVKGELPDFFWTGETDMACVRDSMQSILNHGYAHHIQRLMVLGLYALLAGVDPYKFHQWHMAMYVDAVDWVSLPNTLGMSQYADGGIVGTKPYCATGNYTNRMSNYCSQCRYNPERTEGDQACPFTTLYWDFLLRNKDSLRKNTRMGFQLKNLERKTSLELALIRKRAQKLGAGENAAKTQAARG